MHNGTKNANGDIKESGYELENNYSADRHTTEPQSEALDNHQEFPEYAEAIREKASKVPRTKASKSQGAQVYQNILQKEKNSFLGKGKKNTKQNGSLASVSKMGKNQNLHQKGTGGKFVKSGAYSNGNVNLAPIEPSKKKYAKTQSYKTYNELVQIIQSMSKFEWLEAAGITNKSQLSKCVYN